MRSGKAKLPLIRLLTLVKDQMLPIVLAVFLSLITVFSSIGLLSLGAWIISMAALRPSIAELQVAIVGVRFFGISRGVFRYLERIVSHRVSLNILAELRVFIFTRIEILAPARLQAYRSGDLLNRISADVETLQDFYTRVLAPPLVAILTGLTMITIGFLIAPPVGLVIACGYVTGGVLLPLLLDALNKRNAQDTENARSRLTSGLVDLSQGHVEILTTGASGEYTNQIATLTAVDERARTRMSWNEGVEATMNLLITNATMLIALIVAIPLIDGRMLATLALGIAASFEAITPLPLAAQHLQSSRAAARQLFEVIDAEPAVLEPETPRLLSGSQLVFTGVDFTYPGQTQPVLQDFSLIIEEGSHVAIIGPSGVGKSTLGNLLFRFWEYPSGSITFGGVELRELKAKTIRAAIAAITQDSYLFNMSVRENLKLADPLADQAALEKVIAEAGLAGFINSLKEGLDTEIGEQGVKLSGGERQRVAIAQALLKGGDFFFLDEPTAHLDPQTEVEVLRVIERVTAGKTSILITHRLIGLENMDRIHLMKDGRIIESGTHYELIQQNTEYHRLYDLHRIASDSEQ